MCQLKGGTRRGIEFATIIIMVALALGGCTPEQDVAQCELEAIRLYPNKPPNTPWPWDDADRYVITCMKAKGYEHTGSCPELRFPVAPTHATIPQCYTPIGWRRLLSTK